MLVLDRIYKSNFNQHSYKVIKKIDHSQLDIYLLRNLENQQVIVRTVDEILGNQITHPEFTKIRETNANP